MNRLLEKRLLISIVAISIIMSQGTVFGNSFTGVNGSSVTPKGPTVIPIIKTDSKKPALNTPASPATTIDKPKSNTVETWSTNFPIYINGESINTITSDYPFVTYNNRLYFPMTRNVLESMGLVVSFDSNVIKIWSSTYAKPFVQANRNSYRVPGSSINMIPTRVTLMQNDGQQWSYTYADNNNAYILHYNGIYYAPIGLISPVYRVKYKYNDGYVTVDGNTYVSKPGDPTPDYGWENPQTSNTMTYDAYEDYLMREKSSIYLYGGQSNGIKFDEITLDYNSQSKELSIFYYLISGPEFSSFLTAISEGKHRSIDQVFGDIAGEASNYFNLPVSVTVVFFDTFDYIPEGFTKSSIAPNFNPIEKIDGTNRWTVFFPFLDVDTKPNSNTYYYIWETFE